MSEQGVALKDGEGTEEHVLKLVALYEQRRVRDEMVAARLAEVTRSLLPLGDDSPPLLYVAATPYDASDRVFSPNRHTSERIKALEVKTGPFGSGEAMYRNVRTRFRRIVMAESFEEVRPLADGLREFHVDGAFLGVTAGSPAMQVDGTPWPAHFRTERITDAVVSELLVLGALCKEFAVHGDLTLAVGIATNGPVSLYREGTLMIEFMEVSTGSVSTSDSSDAGRLATVAAALEVAGPLVSDLLSAFGQDHNPYLNEDGAIHLEGWPGRRQAVANWAETHGVPTVALQAS